MALPRAVSQEIKLKKSRALQCNWGRRWAAAHTRRLSSANAARGALGAMPPWVPRGISTVSHSLDSRFPLLPRTVAES